MYDTPIMYIYSILHTLGDKGYGGKIIIAWYTNTYHIAITILPPYPLPPDVCNMLCIIVSNSNYFTSVSFTTQRL
jgi:hypothetical protein